VRGHVGGVNADRSRPPPDDLALPRPELLRPLEVVEAVPVTSSAAYDRISAVLR
jgi:hypothetical protein